MDVYETAILPINEVPPGDGWELAVEGRWNNAWRRPGSVLAALVALVDWDQNSPHALLVAACEAIDAATASQHIR